MVHLSLGDRHLTHIPMLHEARILFRQFAIAQCPDTV
jgi:hypothetical protein